MTFTARCSRALASSYGLFLTALVAGSLSGLGLMGIGDSSPHTVTARFANADGLTTGNEVRVAGVNAGTVSSVSPGVDPATGQQFAVVQFSVDAPFWPLHQGTAVAITPKGVLSNVFVLLSPGSQNNPSLGSSPFFDVNQTQSPVGLEELNNVFTPSVTEAIRTQLQEGVLAFGGSGATNLNATLHYANPLTLDTIPIVDVLATRSPQLDSLNFSFDTISGDLAREDSNLRPLITNLDNVLGALAAKEQDLQGTLVHASDVFGELHQAFGNAGTQQDLINVFKAGAQSLTCAQALSDYLQPLITAVNPYIRYNGQQSLDYLLSEFVTATGFNTGTNSHGSNSTSIDTLSIDPTLPPSSGYRSTDNGGLSAQHSTYHPATQNGTHVYQEGAPLPLPSSLPDGCTPIGGTGS